MRDVTYLYRKNKRILLYTLLNNQTDAQFFMYVYFYSLHVSGTHVPIIRRIIVSMRHLVLHTGRSSTKSDINQVVN